MNTPLLKVLQGSEDNYLYPFFLVPETVSPELLRSDMKRLAANGVKGVCVEPNFNKYFTGPQWWEQMDAIMEEARLQGMRVWLQDEATFPTGNVNNNAGKYPELQKIYLDEQHIDAIGPMKGASFLIKNYIDAVRDSFYPKHTEEQDLPQPSCGKKSAHNDLNVGPVLLSVCACKKVNSGKGVDGDYINLTDRVQDGILNWDLPAGHWRIFIVYTYKFGNGRPNYLNIFDSDAVKLLIEKNYKPHLERYAGDFGKTFAGFFSDEPEFGNVYSYANDNSIGCKKMPLPWSRELAELFIKELGKDAYGMLPALWYESGPCTALVRYTFMNKLTQLYEKNFSVQLGEWCRAHNCEYIGHVVEDMGNHARLGCGAGHYFRSMTGQDYAGIDLVLQQIRPGLDYPDFAWQGGETGGEFFHYGLAKLGSSAAHMDPGKNGRSICEIFAAYGYSLGLKNQKWLFDHMLVRGINNFIPAWNTKNSSNDKASRYDSDPQFRYNHILSHYINRLCCLLSNGIHIAPAAVLYHAESEWSGDYMEFEKPVRVLLQNQIDCDVLPSDVFGKREAFKTTICKEGLTVNQETYKILIIPYSKYITASVAELIKESIEQSFPIFFIDALPEGIVDAVDDESEAVLLKAVSKCSIVPLETLGEVLRRYKIYEITASGSPKGLRYYHYKNNNEDIFMFFNEEPFETINTIVDIPINKLAVCYDAFMNRLLPAEAKYNNGMTSLELSLYPYQSQIVVFSSEDYSEHTEVPFTLEQTKKTISIDRTWNLSLADRKAYPCFHKKEELPQLINISEYGKYPDFSGTMRYDTSFYIESKPERALLSLGEVYETAEVWVNGGSAGVRIFPPYDFDISGLIKEGENLLRIEVINTLAHEMKDTCSKFGVVEPSGLLGPVAIHY